MNIRYLFACVCLISVIACDKKEESGSSSASVSQSESSESQKRNEPSAESVVLRAAPTPRQICVPAIQGVSPQNVPSALRVYCDTKEPLDPVAYSNYMQRLQNAAAEAQQEIATRQQAMQVTGGDSRLAGIQQQQDGCQFHYPGIFPQSPLGGMCANSQAEVDAYVRNQGLGQQARDDREMQQNAADAASQCRRMCISANNPALCRAGCPTG